jgi:5'-3' exonuclease
MKNKDIFALLKDLKPELQVLNDDVLLIDGFNLFFRNFSVINTLNPDGEHIGGLGGFIKSLGYLIKIMNPTHVYVVFDGNNSSQSRKDILPEYKSNRNQKVVNKDIFSEVEEENESKTKQIIRIIQYLKLFPVNVIAIDNVEADDVIAYMSLILSKKNKTKVTIVSNDQDYLQLINENTIIYLGTEKKHYTEQVFTEKYNIPPHNFLIYKLLMGDSSDALSGVKGLGPKKIGTLFPELKDSYIDFEKLIKISEKKVDNHNIYKLILESKEDLQNKYNIMNLNKPMLSEQDKIDVEQFTTQNNKHFNPSLFLKMYNDDKLGNMIKDPHVWVTTTFRTLLNK